jgi:D-arabinose 1-dehydrogenase-like Zn-dependent alcohol dehydrogenase
MSSLQSSLPKKHRPTTYKARAYCAASATSALAPTTIARREPAEHDVQIEILFCGICHSDLHQVRNEWSGMPTVYPIVPGHELVGRVSRVGSAVTRHKPGDLAAVGCLVDSDGTCPQCKAGLEQFCPNLTLTYGSPDKHLGGVTYGGYSDSLVVDERFALRVPARLDPAGAAPLLCAGITTYSPLRHWGVTKGKRVGVVGLGGLGHMGVKFAHAFGAHVVVFTTSPNKKEAALRLGADEVVVSRSTEEMQRQAGSFDFILEPSPPSMTSTPTSTCSAATATSPWSAPPRSPWLSRPSASSWGAAASPAPTSAASPRRRRCSTSAGHTASPPTSRSSPSRRSTKPTRGCSSPT